MKRICIFAILLAAGSLLADGGISIQTMPTPTSISGLAKADSGGHAGDHFMASATGLDSLLAHWNYFKDSIAVIGPKAWAAAPKIDPIFTGTIRGESERLTGYLTTLDTIRAAWSFVGDSTGNALIARSTIGQASLGATPFAGIFGGMVRNMTPATGALQQWSPAYVWQGQGYDSLNRISVPVYFGMAVRPIMTAGAVTSAGFDLYKKIGSGSWTFLETMLSSGQRGIGTTGPGNALTIKPALSGYGLTIREYDDGYDAARILASASQGYVELLSGGTIANRIASAGDSYFNAGNVGIRTTTPYFGLSYVNAGGFANSGFHLVSSTFNLQRTSATTASDTSSIGIRLGTAGQPIFAVAGARGVKDSLVYNDATGAGWWKIIRNFEADTVLCSQVNDKTDAFTGDAVAAIKAIKSKDGKIDHETLPEFARATIQIPIYKKEDSLVAVANPDTVDAKAHPTVMENRSVDVLDHIETQPGRSVNNMVTVLTEALKQALASIDSLEARIAKLEKL